MKKDNKNKLKQSKCPQIFLGLLGFMASENASAQNVSTFDELENAINNGQTNIDYSQDINFKNSLSLSASQTTINGSNNAFYNGGGILSDFNALNITSGQSLELNNVSFKDFYNKTLDGGAIYNDGDLNIEGGIFESNSSEYGAGGAIFNNADIDNLIADFYSNFVNSSYAEGAVIANYGTINTVKGIFEDNYAISTGSMFGGVISNSGVIANIDASFINNSASGETDPSAGVIANYATINKISGLFEGNSISSNTDSAFGGAILNFDTIDSIYADFTNNKSTSYASSNYGGAIANYSYIEEIVGNFYNNSANSVVDNPSSNLLSYAGAIHNTDVIDWVSGNFVGNSSNTTTLTTNGNAYGGAIYNSKGNVTIADSTFLDNHTTTSGHLAFSYGGAIYVFEATTNIIADANNVYFSGNYSEVGSGADYSKTYNSIYLNVSTLNLAPAIGQSIVFNDAIIGVNSGNVINVGDYSDVNAQGKDYSTQGGGSVIFNDVVKNATINLNKGSVVLGEENKYITDDCQGSGCRDIDLNNSTYLSSLLSQANLVMASGTTLDTSNNIIQNAEFNELTLSDGAMFDIDIGHNGTTAVADTFDTSSLTNSSGVLVELASVAFIDGFVNADYTNVSVFDNALISIKDLDVFTVDGSYHIEGNANGNIDIDYTAMQYSLKDAVVENTPNDKLYIMKSDEIVVGDLGVSDSGELTVSGNNNSIIGNANGVKNEGVVISNAHTIIFDNVSTIEGFNNANNGVISVEGTVNINATNNNTLFKDNDGADVYVAATGVANFNAGNYNNIILNTGVAGDGIVNKDGSGELIVNNEAGFSGVFNLNAGSVVLSASANSFFENMNAFNVFGCVVDLANGSILTTNLGALTLNSSLELAIDVNLEAETADKILVNSLSNAGGNNIVIDSINIIEESGKDGIEVVVSDDADVRNILEVSPTISVEGAIYNYNILDDKLLSDGVLIFNKADGGSAYGYNSELFASMIASSTAVINSLDTNLNIVFDNMRSVCNIKECKPQNYYIKTYYQNNDIGYDNYHDVSAETYGVVAGFNGSSIYYGNGIDAIYGLYFASNNGEYKWDGNTLSQNGFNAGFNAMLEYDNAFVNASVGAGANLFDFNDDDFWSKNISLATKIGYHIAINDNISITPSLKTVYTFVTTDDYKTSADVNVKTEDASVWLLSPEIEATYKLNTNTNIYANASYNKNKYFSGDNFANYNKIPKLNKDSYIKYSLGAEKQFSDYWGGYVEASVNSGGQSGYEITAGIKLEF